MNAAACQYANDCAESLPFTGSNFGIFLLLAIGVGLIGFGVMLHTFRGRR